MGKCVRRMICALAALLCLGAQGAAEEATRMQVYVASGAMDSDMAGRLVDQLGRTYNRAQWELVEQDACGMSLRELVLADRAPDLAICSPQEAAPWAREGLLLPLQTRLGEQARIQPQVLQSCVHEEQLFMAPLLARHRQMAVNAVLFEERRLQYLLDPVTHPVWYPTEFQQILEEFALADAPAMELWPAQVEDSAAMEALVQAMYSGFFCTSDGELGQMDSSQLVAGLRWLQDLVNGGMIVGVQSRQAALAHFIRGDTAIFIDWTQAEAQSWRTALAENGVQVQTVPYPASIGLPVRSYDVVGAAVFDSADAQRNALALQAAVSLHEDPHGLLGSREIFRDESIWLPPLETNERGMTLRSLFCGALNDVLWQGGEPAQALGMIRSTLDAAK